VLDGDSNLKTVIVELPEFTEGFNSSTIIERVLKCIEDDLDQAGI
jgi:hypothetical protein